MTKAEPDSTLISPAKAVNFSTIKGVGQSTAQAFLKLGFTSFNDLTRYSNEELADLLRAKGLTISPQRIDREDWIGQAKALSAASHAKPPEPVEFETPWQADADWHELADYFLSFGYLITQNGDKRLITRAAHSQSGDGHNDWDGIGKEQLDECLRWMLERAGLARAAGENSESAAQRPPASVEDSSNADLGINEICETQMLGGSGGVKFESAIRVVANYTLPQSAVRLTAENLSFSAEIYLINLQTNQPRLATSLLKRLQPGVSSYPIVLDFQKPEPGRYQLYLTASLIESTAAPARLKGPIIRIE